MIIADIRALKLQLDTFVLKRGRRKVPARTELPSNSEKKRDGGFGPGRNLFSAPNVDYNKIRNQLKTILLTRTFAWTSVLD